MTNNRNIRLIDIAREVGCTVNTVSRALRDKSDISYETKVRIKEVADKLGYIPNSIATSLRSGSSFTVAIVFDNMVNPYFMIMADKLHRKLDDLGYATMIFAVYNSKFHMDSLNPIISRKVDGIITFLEPNTQVIDACKKNKIPILLLGRKNTQLEIDTISTDDYTGGYKVGELFVECGVKKVGYLGAPREIECSVRRQNGLRDALLEHGRSYDEENTIYMTNRSIPEELEIMIKNEVDAIFFFNDVMALEGIKYLEENSYRIPEEIKIVGYDGIAKEFSIPVSLTTVSADKDSIIDSAVEVLYSKMKDKDFTHSVKVIDYGVELSIGTTS